MSSGTPGTSTTTRGMSGAILCADGDLEIRSFDVVDGGTDTADVACRSREGHRGWGAQSLAKSREHECTRERIV